MLNLPQYVKEILDRYSKLLGLNGKPHIRRVLLQGLVIAARRGSPLTQTERIVLALHDIAKPHIDKEEDHGVRSALWAREMLRLHVRPRTLAAISNAILDHTATRESARSQLGLLLRAADGNRPLLSWFVKKLYNKQLMKLSPLLALATTLRVAKKGLGIPRFNGHIPLLYSLSFKDLLQKYYKDIQNLQTVHDVQKLVALLTEAHPLRSIWE